MKKRFRVGAVAVGPPLVLAPMQGITDAAFRCICKRNGAGLSVSEMVSCEALVRNARAAFDKCTRFEEEKPFSIQLFGSSPQRFVPTAKIICEKRLAEIIDLNSGCPDPQVAANGCGAALLKDLKAFKQVVSALVEASDLPVTVKIRQGWSPRKDVAVEAALVAQEAGAKAVTLHARFASQGYSGKADWKAIARVKDAVGIPVIGNGDVRSAADALSMFAETGCDAVMIGRAAASNPSIFGEVAALAQGRELQRVSVESQAKLLFEYLALVSESGSSRQKRFSCAVVHAHWLARGFDGALETRKRISAARNELQLLAAFKNA
ncbi:TPA: tRNA-dihydrouridine synthase family protein [Candidatus Micrarchaeota archaeon]|nr:MAG: hypothetical protein AUJ65_00305 [Candidatus Micrarchaeota archaeon CG1_02_51_15]HII39492.1 tRNA-dihydrouridine synthase family protein [Candidatus Micrarchaeota archaeon]